MSRIRRDDGSADRTDRADACRDNGYRHCSIHS
jgi:hypothetical protein